MRRGHDRVRIGAASNAVFGVDRLASWRADGATLHSVLEAGKRGIVAVFSPRKRRMLLLELVFGRGKGSYCFGSLRRVTGSRLIACWILSASFRVAHGPRIPLDVTASQPSRKSCS